ncbi:hypothetical protein DAPPUDRAFT_240913 [Daphnia pulex]|uniref:Uncharacterized protein n=1 Tax=Daphnia pulex TaxID=6669 RepID=E9GCX3_DAPPU|nr:hypothetical protein DAPPUDRAFT_240913 [Daphnia pulex]|eukprot:EFX82787.1 hypothetical protein DAPPUDRAFT_240913 [Daphnia pulex]
MDKKGQIIKSQVTHSVRSNRVEREERDPSHLGGKEINIETRQETHPIRLFGHREKRDERTK